ncbi:MAG: hypothetical protein Q8Q63_03415, partial [Phaeovulum sp.]|nr:hypothetical protein [Phaeovulum sp.]
MRAVSVLGTNSDWLELLGHPVALPGPPPADVTGFDIAITGAVAHLRWDPVPDEDLSHHIIRWSPSLAGASYSNAVTLVPKVPRPGTSVTTAARTGTYFIRAVDKLGNESLNPTAIITTIAGVEGLNAVEMVIEDPDFDCAEVHFADAPGLSRPRRAWYFGAGAGQRRRVRDYRQKCGRVHHSIQKRRRGRGCPQLRLRRPQLWRNSMSQNDFVVADQTFPSILADFNAAFQALASASSGAAAPATSYAYQLWADTTDNLLKMRNGANYAWMILAKFDTVNDRWEPRSDVLQALSGSGLTLRDAAGVARATFGAGQIKLYTDLFEVFNAAGTTKMMAVSTGYRFVAKYGSTDRFRTTATGAEIYGALEVDTINGAALAGGFTATMATDGTKSSGTYLPARVAPPPISLYMARDSATICCVSLALNRRAWCFGRLVAAFGVRPS